MVYPAEVNPATLMNDLTIFAPMAQPTLDEIARSQIQRWLETTGQTQTALATQIGRNQAWLSRYLKAEFNADLSTLEKIAQAFNHTVAALFTSPQDPDEAKLVANFRACRPEDRKTLLGVSAAMSRPSRLRGRVRRPRSSPARDPR